MAFDPYEDPEDLLDSNHDGIPDDEESEEATADG